MLRRVGFTISTPGSTPLELPNSSLYLPAGTTQSQRVAALMQADEAAWQQPIKSTSQKIMDWLKKYQTAVLITAAGLFGLAILRRR